MSQPFSLSTVTRALYLAAGLFAASQPVGGQALAPVPAPVSVPGTFAENPIVYFVMTDRFYNGNPANDQSYGRQRENAPKADVGTFHGGDLKGLTVKLKEGWFKALGVNALWITAPYEQIHGWVQGGQKEFKHYAYHGYYALDYTVLDKNMGTPEELRELVDTAHGQGIRILFDIVMNHPGYLDIQTAKDLKIDVLWPDWEKDPNLLRNYHNYIDYNSFKFGDWWGRPWVRAGLPGYMDGGRDDLTMQLAYLPDFRTESTDFVKLPQFLKEKADTRAVDRPNTTVRGYLVQWLTDWVREYGIDGFRADTVKHVEPEAWVALKAEAVKALADFKAKHPSRQVDDAPFWMVGEYWGVGPGKHKLTGFGFDAMINFDFQQQEDAYAKPEKLFKSYALAQAGKPVHMLNYLSSHDTEIFERDRLIEGGAALMLAPGGVQIFYGDETARPLGPVPRTDPQQATRSDMNWASPDEKVLAHWRKLGAFRARHRALATGGHQQLSESPYTFSRVEPVSGDRVVVAMGARGQVSLSVAGVFEDGQVLRDAYTGRTATVAGGKVTLQADEYVLLERVAVANH
ncbi:MAG: alpha-amylase family glycosyl hydrolase [Geothrix sp.]|nr:alpha-amylase family glycosyl hydrolase [Geothrix sp.]